MKQTSKLQMDICQQNMHLNLIHVCNLIVVLMMPNTCGKYQICFGVHKKSSDPYAFFRNCQLKTALNFWQFLMIIKNNCCCFSSSEVTHDSRAFQTSSWDVQPEPDQKKTDNVCKKKCFSFIRK